MNIQQTVYNRLIEDGSTRVPEYANIKQAVAFHAILAKERARVDRNSHVFSLVSFEVGPRNKDMAATNYFIKQLKKQIRITDEVGWLDDHTVGVLLFNALSEEACQFIKKIQTLSPRVNFFRYSISTYPEGKVEHTHLEETGNSCHHSVNGSSLLDDHKRVTGEQAALRLHPVFFDKIPAWKRLIDIAGSISALIALSPLMLIIAIAVKYTSKGPIFYKQQRAGLGGSPFTFLKFRTMYDGADEKKCDLLACNERTGPVFKMANDPRTTSLGKFLRKWSLDELPQFFNVLIGDMSLVGPRPPTMDEVEQYESWHNYRLEVKPGITCIWQVYARHEKSFENWVRLDIKYRQEQSFLLDMKLIALTIPAVLSRKGAS